MTGKWLWHELHTPSKQRAVTFYEALFGWTATDMPMSTGLYTVWQKDGQGHGGLQVIGGPGTENDPPRWLVYIETDDVDRDFRRVADLGGKAMTQITEAAGVGRWFVAEDPTGAQFAIMHPMPIEAPADAKPAKAKARAKPVAKAKPAAKPAAKAKATPKPSPKAKPRKAALKAAKKAVVGMKTKTKVARDTAAAKGRTAALKGRSQNNFRR